MHTGSVEKIKFSKTQWDPKGMGQGTCYRLMICMNGLPWGNVGMSTGGNCLFSTDTVSIHEENKSICYSVVA